MEHDRKVSRGPSTAQLAAQSHGTDHAIACALHDPAFRELVQPPANGIPWRGLDVANRVPRRLDGSRDWLAAAYEGPKTAGKFQPIIALPGGFSESAAADVLARLGCDVSDGKAYWLGQSLSRTMPASRATYRLTKIWDGFAPGATVSERETAIAAGATPWGYPLPIADDDNVSCFNYVSVDLDCDPDDVTNGEAAIDMLATATKLVHRGVLPPFTLAEFSATGVWLHWWLVDSRNPQEWTPDGLLVEHDDGSYRRHQPDSGCMATARARTLRRAVVGELRLRCEMIGAELAPVWQARWSGIDLKFKADKASTNEARWKPLTNSLRPHVGRHVRAVLTAWGQDGGLEAYKLEGLHQWLGLDSPGVPLYDVDADVPILADSPRPTHTIPLQPDPSAFRLTERPTGPLRVRFKGRGRAGNKARAEYVLEDLRRLLDMRGGGNPIGCRMIGALHLGWAIRRALGFRRARRIMREAIEGYAARCQPPMPHADVRKALTSIWKPTPNGCRADVSFRTYRETWRITPAELATLARLAAEGGRPGKGISRDTSIPKPLSDRPTRTAARKAFVLELMSQPFPPTVREIVAQCEAAGHATCLGSASTDRRQALHILGQRSRRLGRPPTPVVM